MSILRNAAVVAFGLWMAGAAHAETYPLAETVQVGDCCRIRLDMKLTGELRIQKGEKTIPLKLEALAAHEFPERALSVNTQGLADKTARHYETARAAITVDGSRSERTLRSDHKLLVAQRYKDQHLVYCPAGALFREEVDLTTSHFDTLFVVGLLPGKPVEVGESWKVPSAVAQAVCNFEGLTSHELTGKLEEVAEGVARFTITGSASGIDLGAIVKVAVQATGRFDLKTKRLVAIEWSQKDEREQGPASPAATIQSNVTLRRQPSETIDALSDVALVSVPDSFTPSATLTQVDFRDPKGRFSLLHAREWQVVSQSDSHTVLRLMERGDFVAQATITPWTAAAKGKHSSAEEFKTAMNDTPGWAPEKELQAGAVSEADDRWVYRLSALGQLDGVPVMQNFYLIAGPNGDQVVVAFSLNPKQADKLGARDLGFVGSLDVPAGKK